jgi:hypothetical protein
MAVVPTKCSSSVSNGVPLIARLASVLLTTF